MSDKNKGRSLITYQVKMGGFSLFFFFFFLIGGGWVVKRERERERKRERERGNEGETLYLSDEDRQCAA